MSIKIDGTSNKSADAQANQDLVANLVSGGGFTEGAGADDEGKEARGAGSKKGGAKANNGAKVTAPVSRAAGGEQLERAGNTPSATATSDHGNGGSLNLGTDVPASRSNAQAADVRALATQTLVASPTTNATNDVQATSEADPASSTPRALDSNPKIAAAQKVLAQDMGKAGISQDTLQKDVKNLVAVTRAQGRGADALQVVTNAMPANASAKFTASIYEMAAKNGVDLDNNASKVKAGVADADVAKAQRAMEKAKAQGGGSGGSSSGATDSSSSSGASKWNGSKATASTATADTSSAGGNKLAYTGPASNFPNDTSKWASWDDLWNKAAGEMAGTNNAEQIGWIKDGIQAEAQKTGIDPRFILAVVMQESSGNVNVGTTNNGVNNPGLMQSHDGASFDGSQASVLQMIKDGVEGTSSGDGLVQGVQSTGNLFAAARLYNSGQMNADNLSDAMGATGSYCSDLANFVMGRA